MHLWTKWWWMGNWFLENSKRQYCYRQHLRESWPFTPLTPNNRYYYEKRLVLASVEINGWSLVRQGKWLEPTIDSQPVNIISLNYKTMKKEKIIKWNKKDFPIAMILIEELQGWESTTAVSVAEFTKLVKRLSKLLWSLFT